jgi:4-hydroxy-3-methylbut-2-enyl diphosphate reductase
LKRRFPQIVGPPKEDICYATQNRQDAVKVLAAEADVVLVVGSQNSSNSQRLRELASTEGKRAFLIDSPKEIRPEWLNEDDVVMLTAGASAPEEVVDECLNFLRERYGAEIENRVVREEHVSFPLPKELRFVELKT